jgi:flagellin
MSAESLGVNQTELTNIDQAQQSIASTARAIDQVSSYRSTIGSLENGISSEVSKLQTELVNSVAAQSRIEDADLAAEIINMNRSELQTKAAINAFKMQDENRTAVLNLLGE